MSEQEQRTEPTPGPWRYYEDHVPGHEPFYVVESAEPRKTLVWDEGRKELTEADARLIAAGPDLRETVEQNQNDVKTARAMLQDGQNVADMETMREIMGNVIDLLDQADERADNVLEGLA